MRTVHAKHEPYTTGQLAAVVEEMRTQGAPTIRVMEYDGKLYALEGSHRLAAASYLGLEPKIVIELPDLGEDLDDFCARVAPWLPVYSYKHIHVLDLKEFVVDG